MRKLFQSLILGTLTLLLLINQAVAAISLSPYYSENLIIQRDKPFTLSGTASPGESVTVQIAELRVSTKADNKGQWSVKFAAHEAADNLSIQFKGENQITLSGVAFGDIWLASGQSNMELPIRRVMEKYPDILKAKQFANVRQFHVARAYDFNQQLETYPQGQWARASADTLSEFSAVAWFFAQDLYNKTGVPIGIINASVGGSPVEAWMSEERLKSYPDILAYAKKFKDDAYVAKIQSDDKQRLDGWFAELNKNDPGLNQASPWYAENIKLSDWQAIQVPGLYSETVPGDFNGSMWFRKTINLTAQEMKEDAKLRLGSMVDADTTYINGVEVDSTGYQYPPRIYSVPSGLLKAGENTITVRLTSHINNIGFVRDMPYYLQTSQSKHDLTGQWQYRIGHQTESARGWDFIHYKPTGLFNAMISPATDHAISGVIWYQGESNTGDPKDYDKKLIDLIQDWRQRWGQSDMPFLIVQLANFMAASEVPTDSNWAQLRYEQYKVSKQLDNVGLAVTIDVGEWNDIHPLDKKSVGQRLALLAQKYAYDEELVYSGPELLQARRVDNMIELEFEHVAKGLQAQGQLKGFSVAAADKKFVWAEAQIKDNKVILTSSLKDPAAFVRYAWQDNPAQANLYNSAGLPAIPFEQKVN